MSNHLRNPELFAAIRGYCLEVFELWRRLYTDENSIPRRAVPRARFEGTSISFQQEIHLDPTRLTSDIRIDDQRQVASRAAVETAMRSDERVARHLDTLVGTSGGSGRVTVATCLTRALIELLEGKDTLLFDEDRFRQIYGAMEDYFYSDTITISLLAPLTTFEMQADRIILGDYLSLRKLSPSEREQLTLQELQFPGVGMLSPFLGQEESGVELIIDVPKVFGERTQPADPATIPMTIATAEFQEVLLALRVFKGGNVDYSITKQIPLGWGLGGAMSSYAYKLPLLGSAYVLSSEEVPRFTTFWEEYRQARRRNRPRIDLALRRLNFGYERTRPEDKLIDYMIGLEALLTRKGGEGSDLAYRLALRGARLLGSDATHRAHIHAELRRAYRLRSDIVHGSEIEVGQSVMIEQGTIAFGDFIERIAQHLREAIKRFMNRTAVARELEVIKALDHEAITAN